MFKPSRNIEKSIHFPATSGTQHCLNKRLSMVTVNTQKMLLLAHLSVHGSNITHLNRSINIAVVLIVQNLLQLASPKKKSLNPL